MPAPAARRLDLRAVERIVRRLDQASEPSWLAREAARRLGERLAIVKRTPARILDASGWIGAAEPVWSAQHGAAQAWSVEHDVQHARARNDAAQAWWKRWMRRAARIEPVARIDVLDAPVDLIVSNLALVACADPPAEFARWQAALGADGFVMFTSLGPGTLPELRTIYAEAGWGPPTLDFVDMHDLGDMLVHAGFADPVLDQETITVTWPDAPALLAELRSIGGNVAPERHAGLRTPRWRTRFEAALQARGTPIALTFELVHGHAFKAVPREAPPGETTVSLEAMRGLVRAGRDGRERSPR